jgi:hypothetical protein
MFAPSYKEITVKTTVKKVSSFDGDRYVPDLPNLSYGLVLVFCDGVNYYGYPLPASTLGKDCIAHVVYFAKDDKVMQEFKGKLGAGNAVCKTADYKSVVKTTVASAYIAQQKEIITAAAEAKGEVVKQEYLDAVKYEGIDKDDGYPIFVFLQKEYVDR